MNVLMSLLVAAAPGDRWQWSVVESFDVKATGLAADQRVTPRENLGASAFELTVLERSGPDVRKVSMKGISGALTGRTWIVEANYGDAILTETSKGKQRPTPKPLRDLAATLVGVDPVGQVSVESPCSKETTSAIADATWKLVARWMNLRPDQSVLKAASATCTNTPGTYAVAFRQAYLVIDQEIEMKWSGTVTRGPPTTRSSLAIKATLDDTFSPGPGKKTWHLVGRAQLSSLFVENSTR